MGDSDAFVYNESPMYAWDYKENYNFLSTKKNFSQKLIFANLRLASEIELDRNRPRICDRHPELHLSRPLWTISLQFFLFVVFLTKDLAII